MRRETTNGRTESPSLGAKAVIVTQTNTPTELDNDPCDLYNCTSNMAPQTITVDASAILAVVLNEPTRELLLSLTLGATLVSAPTLPWEVGNALSALFKKNRLQLPEALQALEQFRRIPVQVLDTDVGASIATAHRLNLYAYDAYVIECARAINAPLLSLDRRQREAARQVGVVVLEV